MKIFVTTIRQQENIAINCYVEWFLLSMCPEVCITAGNQDLSDFSTFGYSAAMYGLKQIKLIFN